MHIQFSTTQISSPLPFGWKFESVPQEEDPATDPPDNQGGGTPGTETKPTTEEEEAVPEGES